MTGRLSLSQELDLIRNCGAEEVEASGEGLIPHYPYVTDAFASGWKGMLKDRGLRAGIMDSFIDRFQFRTHSMTHQEMVQHVEMDLSLAASLGFSQLRLMHDLPIEVMRDALPAAEHCHVRMLDEILEPGTIRRCGGRKGEECADIMDLIRSTGTEYLGLLVNLEILQNQPSSVELIEPLARTRGGRARAEQEAARIYAGFHDMPRDAFFDFMHAEYPELSSNEELLQRMFGVRIFGDSVQPEDLREAAPYIGAVYAYFHFMTENGDGSFDEPCIPYRRALSILHDSGYDGSLITFCMGSSQQAFGEGIDDICKGEQDAVARNQKMLQQLLASLN